MFIYLGELLVPPNPLLKKTYGFPLTFPLGGKHPYARFAGLEPLRSSPKPPPYLL